VPPLLAISISAIDPIAFSIGPFAFRWYALAYIAGLLLGWWYCRRLCARTGALSKEEMDDLLLWITLGVVLGGRLGYVLFYQPGYYLFAPLEALKIWRGGMSFHGGLLGVLLAIWLFARKKFRHPLAVGDVVACATPIGLFFGRVANFVNAELYGRASELPWAIIFPGGGPLPRHPSQIYEAILEGIVLFALLYVLAWRTQLHTRPGLLGGVFLAGYGVARFLVEYVREPDAHLGFLFGFVTMGQILSLPMLGVGALLILAGLAGRTETLWWKRD
jgi:phosphatidylglycerol---prolipoprotein diacylglyceryl transferase